MKRGVFLAVFGWLVWLQMAGCTSMEIPQGEFPAEAVDRQGPAVLSITPSHGAMEVAVDSALAVTFSEILDASSLDSNSFQVLKDNQPVIGEIALTGNQVSFTPRETWDYDSRYEVALKTAITDPSGNPLVSEWRSAFSTEIFSTHLPLVIVDTMGIQIPDEPKVPATMKIVFAGQGELNHLSDSPNLYDGGIAIEIRGTLSQIFPKKQYSFETVDGLGEESELELLGMPEESDWILQGPYLDRSLLRNFLAYDLSNKMGRYAARMVFAELFLIQGANPARNRYAGIYAVMEKIKRDGNRVDIARLRDTDNAEPAVTGGYILALDHVKPEDSLFVTDRGTLLIHEYPDGDDITPAQRDWIKAYMNDFETALHGPDFQDELLGYRAFIDVASFVDYLLINEALKNPDAFRASTFLFKDREGLLNLGPVWDFDLAMGNDGINFQVSPEGWLLHEALWIGRLMDDPFFVEAYVNRYHQLRSGALKTENLQEALDSRAAQLGDAVRRNFLRWPILGVETYPFPLDPPLSYESELENLRDWLEARLHWMDEHIDSMLP